MINDTDSHIYITSQSLLNYTNFSEDTRYNDSTEYGNSLDSNDASAYNGAYNLCIWHKLFPKRMVFPEISHCVAIYLLVRFTKEFKAHYLGYVNGTSGLRFKSKGFA